MEFIPFGVLNNLLGSVKMLAIVGKYGRLGNQLWTYANVLAYACENKIPIINAAFEGDDFFSGVNHLHRKSSQLSSLVFQSGVLKKLIRLIHKGNLRLKFCPFIQIGESNLLNLEANHDFLSVHGRFSLWFLSGFYFVAPRCLNRNKKMIKDFFSLVPSLERKVADMVLAAKQDRDVLIGIHIRQGDYRTFCNGVMYYSTEEYVAVMRSMAGKIENKRISFLVCSDERQDNNLFRGLDVYISDADAIVDMYALARCDYILGPNSSFSQWASFYGEVPLHVLDWKAAEAYQHKKSIHEPDLSNDFCIYSAEMFGMYSNKEVTVGEIKELLGRK